MQSTKNYKIVIFLGLFALLAVTHLDAATIYVNDNATGANNGSSWTDAFTELQSALAMATSGDEIWVATGIYKPDYDVNTGTHTGDRTATFQLISGVALYGGFAGNEDPDTFNLGDRTFTANETILSGDLDNNDGSDFANNDENSYHVVTGNEMGATTVFDGFIVTAGNANGYEYIDQQGGGMLNIAGLQTISHCIFQGNKGIDGGGMANLYSSPNIRDCLFIQNYGTSSAAGMWNWYGSPSLINCIFSENFATWSGAGAVLYRTNATLINCIFTDNKGYTGAGISSAYGQPVLRGCVFKRNVAGYRGGGMSQEYGHATLSDCIFEENTSDEFGGGLENSNYNYGSAMLINCRFLNNTAKREGGGINNSSGMVDWATTMVNCLFSGNSAPRGGGGIRNGTGDIKIANCAFYKNTSDNIGGGLQHEHGGTAMLSNCIFWRNATDNGTEESAQIGIEDATVVVNHSCIENWTGSLGGVGNIGDDPHFINADGPDGIAGTEDDNLRLQSESPCIDTGDNDALPDGITTDLDGNPRILNVNVDMGAYEFQGIPVDLDILPDDCPNQLTVNTRSKGKLPMAILGTESFNANQIDVNSISINGSVFPVRTPKIDDVCTPAEGDECECHIAGADGHNDLIVHFLRREVILALELDTLEPGTVVPISVYGLLSDGTLFKATDCVTLMARED
ncbi:MAG: choice-of-anchor Q domain-containing protein [Planctomycetota bacterium]